ncbi:MAG: type II toxin-antitoxin system VapC family toxin [Armatimonadetes bacterium]|nr:type II toxin-antitoxin system VapC family toxin [Armatimonadota bacterium]
MILLDTHAWIWWACEAPELSAVAKQAIEDADVIGVSAISVWEIAVLVRKERVRFDRSVETWLAQALALPGIRDVAVSSQIALQAELLPDLPGDPADRILAATAIHYGCPLVTKDAKLQAYPALRWVW